MKNYMVFYTKISQPLRRYSSLGRLVVLLNSSITKLMYLFYPSCLLWVWLSSHSLLVLLPYLLIPSVSFVLVSFIRKGINKPRPYETWDIQPLIQKESNGCSIPSRHVFSATIISMCLLTLSTSLGIVCLILSALLGVCRVLVGVHYPSDVLVGYLIGLICGSLLFF